MKLLFIVSMMAALTSNAIAGQTSVKPESGAAHCGSNSGDFARKVAVQSEQPIYNTGKSKAAR